MTFDDTRGNPSAPGAFAFQFESACCCGWTAVTYTDRPEPDDDDEICTRELLNEEDGGAPDGTRHFVTHQPTVRRLMTPKPSH